MDGKGYDTANSFHLKYPMLKIMKVNKLLLLIIVAVLISSALSAQDELLQEGTPPYDVVYLQQILTAEVSFNQINENYDESTLAGNRAIIVQTGSGNNARINQSGNYNYSGIIQTGDYNMAKTDLIGDWNFDLIEQYGSYNIAEKTIAGDGYLNFLQQIGNQITFSMEQNLPSGSWIVQEGNNMEIVIR